MLNENNFTFSLHHLILLNLYFIWQKYHLRIICRKQKQSSKNISPNNIILYGRRKQPSQDKRGAPTQAKRIHHPLLLKHLFLETQSRNHTRSQKEILNFNNHIIPSVYPQNHHRESLNPNYNSQKKEKKKSRY